MTEPDRSVPPEVAAVGEDRKPTVERSAAMMSVLVIISRITGFLRTWGQAFALGVTVTSSCYTVANNLPNQLYELVMGGMLMTAFLPVYLSVKKKAGTKGASEYASNLLSLVLIIMGALFVASLVLAVPIVWTQSFSANQDFDSGLAVFFFRFFAVEVMLYALSSVLSGVLNAERDYLWSNAAPIFNNIVCTASFFLYAFFLPTNPQLAVLSLAVGNPLGVAVQVVMQIPSIRRHGIKIRPYVNVHDPAIRETLSIGIPSLAVTLLSFVTTAVQTSSALSVTVSGASVAYYARLWYVLPYAIFAVPITVAMFTELSDDVARGDMRSFIEGLSTGSSKVMFFLIPFTLYLIVFAVPLVTLLAAGKFSSDDIAMTATYLRLLAVSLPFYGISTYLQKACSSLRRMIFFALASCVGSALQVFICFAFTPAFGLGNVALSSTFFFAALDVVTFLNLRHQIGHLGMRSVLLSSMRSLGLGVAGAIVGWLVLLFFGARVEGTWGIGMSLVCLVAGGIPAVLVTYGLATLLKVPEASAINALIAKVKRKRA